MEDLGETEQVASSVEAAPVTLEELEVRRLLREAEEADPGVAGEPTVSPEVGCEAVESTEADDIPGNATANTEVS